MKRAREMIILVLGRVRGIKWHFMSFWEYHHFVEKGTVGNSIKSKRNTVNSVASAEKGFKPTVNVIKLLFCTSIVLENILVTFTTVGKDCLYSELNLQVFKMLFICK